MLYSLSVLVWSRSRLHLETSRLQLGEDLGCEAPERVLCRYWGRRGLVSFTALVCELVVVLFFGNSIGQGAFAQADTVPSPVGAGMPPATST